MVPAIWNCAHSIRRSGTGASRPRRAPPRHSLAPPGTRAGFDILTGAVFCEAENCLGCLYVCGLLNADGPTATCGPATPRYEGWPPARDPESGGGGEVIARGHD